MSSAEKKPKVLLMGQLFWAQQDCEELLGSLAEVVPLESSSRAEFIKDLQPGGKYGDIVGLFEEGGSAKTVGSLDEELINALPQSLKWIAHKGAGYDNVAVHVAKSRGIGVSNTPGAVDEATATTALYLLIGAMRQFSVCESRLRAGGFAPMPDVESNSRDLSGKVLGVFGLGGIGLTLAGYARALGMRVLYHNRKPSADAPKDLEYVADFYELLKQVDVLSVHVPLGPKTKHIVGDQEIRTMKKGGVIINTARGAVIDEEALIRALEDGHLRSAGLDVFPEEPKVNPKLIAMENITLLPHVGTENRDARRKMEVVALTNLRDYITTGKGKTLVPECR